MTKMTKEFEELEYETRMLLEIEDWMQSNLAPRKYLGFLHNMIAEATSEEIMEHFILKEDSWRKDEKKSECHVCDDIPCSCVAVFLE